MLVIDAQLDAVHRKTLFGEHTDLVIRLARRSRRALLASPRGRPLAHPEPEAET